jgi:hypothetical protein
MVSIENNITISTVEFSVLPFKGSLTTSINTPNLHADFSYALISILVFLFMPTKMNKSYTIGLCGSLYVG